MVPSMVNELYIIRFAVCAKHATDDDMLAAFRIIQEHAGNVLAEYRAQRARRQSTSVDSFESATKRASVTNLEQDIPISEEIVNPEASTETQIAPTVYPTTKVRVIRAKTEVKSLDNQFEFLSFSQIQ